MRYIRSYLIGLFVILCYRGAAQNKTNEHGLKYGHWNVGEVECDYKIVPFSFFDTVSFDGNDHLKARVFNGRDTTTESIAISGYYGDSLSVLDGVFASRDSNGAMVGMVIYRNGIYGSSISFDKGDTVQYAHSFRDVDSNYYDSYTGNRVFSRMHFVNHELTYDYYPQNDLVISDAAPHGDVDLSKCTDDTISIFLTAKKEQFINGISYGSNLKLYFNEYEPAHFPLALCPGDTVWLRIADHQRAEQPRPEDTVSIIAADAKYNVYISTAASHLSKNNITTLQALTLSRKTDKFLVVYSCGPYGHMTVNDSAGKVAEYEFEGSNVYMIALSELPESKYQLDIRMCYDDDMGIGGKIDLYLKE